MLGERDMRWVLRDICMWLGVGCENTHMIVWESSHDTDSYINICIYIRDICMWLGVGCENTHMIVWESSHDTDSQYIHIHICKEYEVSHNGYLYMAPHKEYGLTWNPLFGVIYRYPLRLPYPLNLPDIPYNSPEIPHIRYMGWLRLVGSIKL